jgi:hypothetical protein
VIDAVWRKGKTLADLRRLSRDNCFQAMDRGPDAAKQ